LASHCNENRQSRTYTCVTPAFLLLHSLHLHLPHLLHLHLLHLHALLHITCA